MPEAQKNIKDQARANVFWGESLEAVRTYLLDNKVSEVEANELIELWFSERSVEVRKRGLRKTVIGLILLIAGLFIVRIGRMSKLFGYGIIVFFNGIFAIIDGIGMLIRSSKIKGSVTEM